MTYSCFQPRNQFDICRRSLSRDMRSIPLQAFIGHARICQYYIKCVFFFLRDLRSLLPRREGRRLKLLVIQPEDPTIGFKSLPSIKNPQRTFLVLNPWLHPSDIFVPHVNNFRAARYVSVMNPQQALLYTAGACIDYGLPTARAAWSLIFRPEAPEANVSCRLEQDGPQTLHRAELRAVIGALQYRNWNSEGFRSIVIAINSEYVFRGATEWAWKWEKNGWKNPVDGLPVANRGSCLSLSQCA